MPLAPHRARRTAFLLFWSTHLANITRNRALPEATQAKLVAQEMTKLVMHTIGGDEFTCMLVVAEGRRHWRNTFLREMKGMLVDETIADRLYDFFCGLIVKRHRAEHSSLTPEQVARVALDHTEVEKPLTQADIINDLEILDDSSPEFRRQVYGPGEGPENAIRKLKDEALARLDTTGSVN